MRVVVIGVRRRRGRGRRGPIVVVGSVVSGVRSHGEAEEGEDAEGEAAEVVEGETTEEIENLVAAQPLGVAGDDLAQIRAAIATRPATALLNTIAAVIALFLDSVGYLCFLKSEGGEKENPKQFST